MFRSMKDLERYEVWAVDGDVGKVADFLFDETSWTEWSATYPVDADYAEELARHYKGIPGWRGRDRRLAPETPRQPAGDEPSIDDGAVAHQVVGKGSRVAPRGLDGS